LVTQSLLFNTTQPRVAGTASQSQTPPAAFAHEVQGRRFQEQSHGR
jgi:hypothetical protein